MMKRVFFLLFLVGIGGSIVAQEATHSAKVDVKSYQKAIKVGTVLTYDVSALGQEYQFIVTIEKLGKTIGFKWEMTPPSEASGSIEMDKLAVKNGIKLHSYFIDGEHKVLTDATSVWVSQKIYSDAKKNAVIDMNPNGMNSQMNVSFSSDLFTINGNSTLVPIVVLDSQQTGFNKFNKTHVEFVDSKKFPIITFMKLGWTIRLSSIQTK